MTKCHFFACTVAESITCMPKESAVFSCKEKRHVNTCYVCWSMSDDYNFCMNDNDITEKLCSVNQQQCIQYNQKCWWAFSFGDLKLSLWMHSRCTISITRDVSWKQSMIKYVLWGCMDQPSCKVFNQILVQDTDWACSQGDVGCNSQMCDASGFIESR